MHALAGTLIALDVMPLRVGGVGNEIEVHRAAPANGWQTLQQHTPLLYPKWHHVLACGTRKLRCGSSHLPSTALF